jgi:hypothetical protein
MDLYAVGRGVRYEGLTITADEWQELRHRDFRAVSAWAVDELDKEGRHIPEWLRAEG